MQGPWHSGCGQHAVPQTFLFSLLTVSVPLLSIAEITAFTTSGTALNAKNMLCKILITDEGKYLHNLLKLWLNHRHFLTVRFWRGMNMGYTVTRSGQRFLWLPIIQTPQLSAVLPDSVFTPFPRQHTCGGIFLHCKKMYCCDWCNKKLKGR